MFSGLWERNSGGADGKSSVAWIGYTGAGMLCLRRMPFVGGIATAQTGFSLASIKGTYGFSFSAAIPGATSVDFVGGTGVYHADGAGHLSGTEKLQFHH